MRRAILVALGIGTIITSAAALGIGVALAPETHSAARQEPAGVVAMQRARDSARTAQRARIEERYLAERAACAPLGGLKRDRCLIAAHATRGRALLEAAAPYETRS
jgi:hypothetical protein